MIEPSDGGEWGFRLALLAGLLAASAAPGSAAARRPGGYYGPLARAGARLAWRTPLPLKCTGAIRSYRLLDEYLYAIGADGKVWAIRADTGERVWTRRLARPEEKLWPPTAYRSPDLRAVVFTSLDKAVFLDPATGLEIEKTDQDDQGEPRTRTMGPVRLRSATLASVAASPEHVFAIAPNNRVRRYDIADSYESWQMETPGRVRLAPVFLARYDLLLVADTGGQVAGVSGADRTRKFTRQLQGEPVGWLAADHEAVCVATSEPRLYTVDLATGQVQLEYRLPGRPTGGPVVTETSVYQATRHGLQRVGKKQEFPNWLAPEAKCFLAEWPRRVVLLRSDGKIDLVRRETGESLDLVDLGQEKFDGAGNPWNDAVILASPQGEIWCLRPIGAGPLTPADFRPPAPEMPEAKDEPAVVDEGTTVKEESAEAPPEEEPAEKEGPRMTLEERLIADPLRPQ